MPDDKIAVGKYERSRPKKRKPEPLDGRGVELPHVAPQEGPGIYNIPPPQAGPAAPRRPSGGGVKIIGGGAAGRRGNVDVKRSKQ